MGVLLWILFGALAGWLASVIMNTEASHGILTDILLGIAGSILGGFIVGLIGGTGVTGFNLSSLLVAIIGAVVLIWLSRLLRGSTA